MPLGARKVVSPSYISNRFLLVESTHYTTREPHGLIPFTYAASGFIPRLEMTGNVGKEEKNYRAPLEPGVKTVTPASSAPVPVAAAATDLIAARCRQPFLIPLSRTIDPTCIPPLQARVPLHPQTAGGFQRRSRRGLAAARVPTPPGKVWPLVMGDDRRT